MSITGEEGGRRTAVLVPCAPGAARGRGRDESIAVGDEESRFAPGLEAADALLDAEEFAGIMVYQGRGVGGGSLVIGQ